MGMASRWKPVTAWVAMVIASGCATARAGDSSPDRDVIAETELAQVEARTTAMQLVRRLRPFWLQGRGATRLSGGEHPIPVYVDGQRLGGPEILERYAAGDIQEIRFLDSIAATQRFGTGHVSGAILITMRRGPRERPRVSA